MGLMIHSLGELPQEAERGYYIYLLDYGWDEPLSDALYRNFDRMSDAASRHDAVVLRGVVGSHFADEVLSWHHVNGEPSEGLLPALLITTRHPNSFREQGFRNGKSMDAKDRLLLIPLRQVCASAGDVATVIDHIFRDIREGKNLSGFEVAREMRQGQNGAVTDALILQPNVAGIGINFNYIIDFFRGRRK
jgi:hypothetical protein